MTIQELHYDLLLKIDKVSTLDKDNLIPAERDWILNEGIILFVNKRYGLNNIYRAGFESIHKRTMDLLTLQIKCPTDFQPALVPTDKGNNTYEVKISDLATDCWFITRGYADIDKINCGKRTASLMEVQHDDLNDVLENPFEKPSFLWSEVPVVFGRTDQTADDEGSLYLYSNDDFSISAVYLEYIKKPNKVSIGGYNYIDGNPAVLTECDLPERVHSQIVDEAVAELSRIIEDPRFLQLKNQKLSINE